MLFEELEEGNEVRHSSSQWRQTALRQRYIIDFRTITARRKVER